ncbi:MAG: PAS domain-containing protein [Burkholderiales bacterium]|nr:PAS domain-containing protein [Burkholderiales bacterium]
MANLLASAELPVVFLAADRTIKRFTPPATRLFSLIATDVGRPLGDITARFSDPELHADIDAVLRTLAPRSREIRTGEGEWYLRRVTPYRTEGNRIEGAVLTFADVTAIKQAEASLREMAAELERRVDERTLELQAEVAQRGRAEEAARAEHEFLGTVLETTEALVVVLDAGGRIVRLNAAAERTSGYRNEDVAGKTLWDLGLLLAEELPAVRAVFERLLAGETPLRWENHWVPHDGKRRLIAWSNAVLRDEQGGILHVIGTGVDVSEQRAAEDRLRVRTEELALLHRRYTASGLAAMIGHELNQPLAAIAGYAEACLQTVRGDPRAPEAIVRNAERIAVEAVRAGRFVNGLRRLISRGGPELRADDLNSLVRSACEILGPQARRANVRQLFSLDERLAAVRCSAIQIEHVIVNLARNAIEAIVGAGLKAGEVVITTRRTPEGMAQVSVTDDGPGIAPELAEKVFDPFYTTKDDGVGMGLAICRTLVEAHGGRIWAESGRGGKLYFTLPFAS